MRTARGLTLVEILVSLAVTSVAIAAAMVAATAQERAYHDGNRLRGAQGAAREALLYIERKLPLAGYGMDAPLAFDFKWYSPAAAGTCPAEMAPCVPDKVDDADEVTFYARNPAFWVSKVYGEAVTTEPKGKAWNVIGLHGNTLSLKAHLGDQFRKGQILQLVCAGELDFAYFTVNATHPMPNAVPAEGTQVDLVLDAVDGPNPFKRQDVALTLSCFGDPSVAANAKSNAKVFQIDRYRFHVRPVALGGAKFQPYLMLDQGIDTDADGDVDADDETYLVEGVESLQVAYVFADTAAGAAGAVPGTAMVVADPVASPPGVAPNTLTTTRFQNPIQPPPAGTNDYDYSSFYRHSTITLPAERKTNAQANVRRVMVTVVGRSPEPDPTGRANLRYDVGTNLYRLNQTTAPAWITNASAGRDTDGFQRAVAESSLALPNMLIRSMSYF